MDRQEQRQERLMAVIMGIAENFEKEISPTLMRMWLKLLSGYSVEQVEAGALLLIETYTFKTLPPFAVLRECILKASGSQEGNVELQAVAEWAKLQGDIVHYGSYRKPDMHPVTEQVLRMMGGWSAACCWETRVIDFKRREFLELWAQTHGKEHVIALGANAALGAGADGIEAMVSAAIKTIPGTEAALN